MAKISNDKWVEIHRRRWLRNSKTDLQVKFGNDPEVYGFILDWYKYIHWMNRGNEPGLDELDYASWASGIVRTSDYKDSAESLAENPVLLAELRKLHRRYAKMTIPRY